MTVETTGVVDQNENLHLHHPLKVKNKKVRVVVQVLEDFENASKAANFQEKPKSSGKKQSAAKEEKEDFDNGALDDLYEGGDEEDNDDEK